MAYTVADLRKLHMRPDVTDAELQAVIDRNIGTDHEVRMISEAIDLYGDDGWIKDCKDPTHPR